MPHWKEIKSKNKIQELAMIKNLTDRISKDLEESRISWKVAFAFIPIAFFTYIFHEFGHWIVGEIFGNEMTLGLNNCVPISGHFINDSHALWSAIGGPAFTIIQALIFLVIIHKTKLIYAYSVMFFAVFSRFFSIVFGGLDLQDEAGIASLIGANKYLIATIVLLILFMILWKSNHILKLNLKAVGYFTVLGTFTILIVIGINELII